MARPRTPSNVLELRGSFQTHPERRRKDAEGAGPFNHEPPAHLPGSVIPAWRYLVVRLPMIALSSSDEIAVEMAARVLAAIWAAGEAACHLREFSTLNDALSKWVSKLGMSPADRTKIPPVSPDAKTNRFANLKAPKDEGPGPG